MVLQQLDVLAVLLTALLVSFLLIQLLLILPFIIIGLMILLVEWLKQKLTATSLWLQTKWARK